MGKLIITCGPSGVGKKTIWGPIVTDKKYNIVYSISMTTRKQRIGEKNGVDYFFVSKHKFLKTIKNNQLLEWAQYINNYYGTPKNFVVNNIAKGKNIFLEIEIQGAMKIIKNWNNSSQLVSIFITPPSLKVLQERLINRNTESQNIIKKRITQAKKELSMKKHFKYIIINDLIDRARNELSTILNKELLN